MFDPTDDKPADPNTMPAAQAVNPEASKPADEGTMRRHRALMQALRDEGQLQAEERIQMAIDSDYYDHLQWREEDAMVLMERGQSPLVFNEARQTIDWVLGIQKRQRMDYDILPRTEAGQAAAEAKSKVFKYVSDANLAQWHVSRAFKQAANSGLGWLEEGIETDPDKEQIHAGSEDWRNVFRDSRAREFDLSDGRYLFRKKRIDLDYAIALLPQAADHLRQQSAFDPSDRSSEFDDVWYLGERLTGSTDLSSLHERIPGRFRDRSAYIGGASNEDRGRRLSVDLIESWYRIPEAVQLFRGGPLKGQEFNPADDAHQQLKRDRWTIYRAVAKRMRVMVGTEAAPCWDGKSPFKHGQFLLVPVWGYRRGRDGQCYGLMRGMRDINDDINKRASKALHAASSNRVISRKGNVDDPDQAREEAARPDMWLEVADVNGTKFEQPIGDMKANLELMVMDRELMRNIGGVTQANLGQDSRAISGKAIGLQQDQGSLTTSELPDNLRLALQIAGRLRLQHIEQFMTEAQVIRVTGEAMPTEWLPINQPQEDGSVLNDMAADRADFIVAERDYRESYAQAAMEQMMELLAKIASFPGGAQIVLNVMDLVVDNAEIRNKDEWVARIRKINGQRDPKKTPTPEEQQQPQDNQDQQQRKQMEKDTLQAQLDKLRAEVSKLDTGALLQRVESMFSALQAAQIVAQVPGVAPVADTIAAGAGFKDQQGQDPNLPQPAVQPGMQPQMPGQPGAPGLTPPHASPLPNMGLPPGASPPIQPNPDGLDGVRHGIETPTGADNGPAIQPQGA